MLREAMYTKIKTFFDTFKRALVFNSLKYQTIKNICAKGLHTLPLDNNGTLVTKNNLIRRI